MSVTRISFSSIDRRVALLEARKSFNALAFSKIDMPRHEHVRKDRRVYIDASASESDVRAVLGSIVGDNATYESAELSALDECANCGNVADAPSAVCPNCDYREIAKCPNCGSDVARQEYTDLPGDLCDCPKCGQHLRMRFNEPLWNQDGTLNQPAVVLEVV